MIVEDVVERIRAVTISQCASGGLNVLSYALDVYDGTRQNDLDAAHVLRPGSPPDPEDAPKVISFHGDVREADYSLLAPYLPAARSLCFHACSSSFIRDVLSQPGRWIRSLSISWSVLEHTLVEAPYHLSTISLQDCQCKPEMLENFRATTIKIRPPTGPAWYANILPFCSDCFITLDEPGVDPALLVFLGNHPSLARLYVSGLFVTYEQLIAILSVKCKACSLHGTAVGAARRAAILPNIECEELSLDMLVLTHPSAVSMLVRSFTHVRILSLAARLLAAALANALQSSPVLQELSLRNCSRIAPGIGITLPTVKVVYLGSGAAKHSDRARTLFPNAEIVFG